MKWKSMQHVWEMIIINDPKIDNRNFRFHEDYIVKDKGLTIKDFSFKSLFGEFKIFNGLTLETVDNFLVECASLMNEIRDRRLKNEKLHARVS